MKTAPKINARVWTDPEGFTAVDVEGPRIGDDTGVGRPLQISVRSVDDVAALGRALIRAADLAKGGRER